MPPKRARTPQRAGAAAAPSGEARVNASAQAADDVAGECVEPAATREAAGGEPPAVPAPTAPSDAPQPHPTETADDEPPPPARSASPTRAAKAAPHSQWSLRNLPIWMTMVAGAVTSVAAFLNASSTIATYFWTAKQKLPVDIVDHLRNLTAAPTAGTGACGDVLLELRPINNLVQPWSAYLADITTVQDILSKRRRGWLEGLVAKIDAAVGNAQQEAPLRGGPRGIFLTGPEGSMLTRWMHRVWHDSIASSPGTPPPAPPAADSGDGETTRAAPAWVPPSALPPVTLVFDYAAQLAFASLDAACVPAVLDNSVRYALASTARLQRGAQQQQRGAPAAATDGDRLPPVILYMPHLAAAALAKVAAVVQQLPPTYVVMANTHDETAVNQVAGALAAAKVHVGTAPSLETPVLGSAIISALAPDNHAIMMRADTIFHYCKPSVSCLMMVGIAAKQFPKQSNDFLRFMKASSATQTQTGDKLMAMLAVGARNTAGYGKLCALFMHDELPAHGGPHDDEYRATAASAAPQAGVPSSEPTASSGTFAPCLPERVITAWFSGDDNHAGEDFMEQLRAEGLLFITADQRCTRLVTIPWARQLVDDWIKQASEEAQARAWSSVVDAVAEEVSTGSLTSVATAASLWAAAVRHGGGATLTQFLRQFAAALPIASGAAHLGSMRSASRSAYQAHAASAVVRAVRVVAIVTAMAGQELLEADATAVAASNASDAQGLLSVSADDAPFTTAALLAAAEPVVTLVESLALHLADPVAMQAAVVSCSSFRLRYGSHAASAAAFERLNATLGGGIGAEACGVWARVLVVANHHAAGDGVLSYCIRRAHREALAAAVHRAVHGGEFGAPQHPPATQAATEPAAIAALRRDRAFVRLALHLGHAPNRQKLGLMAADWVRAALTAVASGTPADTGQALGDSQQLQRLLSCSVDDAHSATSCAQGAVADMENFLDAAALAMTPTSSGSGGGTAAVAAADDLRAALLGLSAALQVAGRAPESRALLASLLGGLSGTAPTAFKVQLLCGAFAAQVLEGRQPEEHVQAAHTACSAVASDGAGAGGSGHGKSPSADVGFYYTSPKMTTAASIVEGLLAS